MQCNTQKLTKYSMCAAIELYARKSAALSLGRDAGSEGSPAVPSPHGFDLETSSPGHVLGVARRSLWSAGEADIVGWRFCGGLWMRFRQTG